MVHLNNLMLRKYFHLKYLTQLLSDYDLCCIFDTTLLIYNSSFNSLLSTTTEKVFILCPNSLIFLTMLVESIPPDKKFAINFI